MWDGHSNEVMVSGGMEEMLWGPTARKIFGLDRQTHKGNKRPFPTHRETARLNMEYCWQTGPTSGPDMKERAPRGRRIGRGSTNGQAANNCVRRCQ